MFGYVVTNQEELKIREYKEYRSFYCGLCHTLKERHGIKGQMTLNYDMVFLALLLTGLYEPEMKKSCKRCIVHPIEKHPIVKNEMLDYVSDMNILLSYYKLKDDWKDNKNVIKNAGAWILKRDYDKVYKRYPRQAAAIREYMEKLADCEKRVSDNIDEAAGLTGDMMAELFVYKEDEWQQSLKKIGFYLGKFVYLLDAYDDLKSDIKKNQYNVWKSYCEEPDFRDKAEKILTMMMSECCREFEKLPILYDVNILRNILYAGVFVKFDSMKQENTNE